jgi:acyl transferase domain-containing protein
MEKAKVKASDISVAAVNGPKMTVISGRKEVVDKAEKPHGSRFALPRVQFMGRWYHLRACQGA